jgi:hypothetical protein
MPAPTGAGIGNDASGKPDVRRANVVGSHSFFEKTFRNNDIPSRSRSPGGR